MKYIIELSDDEMEKVKNSHKALFIDVYRMMANIIKNGIPLEQEPFINKPCVSEGACREDKIQVLDKIRTELIQSIQNGTLKIESGNEELFRIIDKYKRESEE